MWDDECNHDGRTVSHRRQDLDFADRRATADDCLDFGGFNALAVDIEHTIPAAKNDEHAVRVAARDIPGPIDTPGCVLRVGLQAPGDEAAIEPFTQGVVAAANYEFTRDTALTRCAIIGHNHRLGVGHQGPRRHAHWILAVVRL